MRQYKNNEKRMCKDDNDQSLESLGEIVVRKPSINVRKKWRLWGNKEKRERNK